MKNEIPVWPGWNTVKLLGRGTFGGVYEIERDFYGDVEKAALKVLDIPQNEYEIDELRSEGYDDASITATFHDQLQCIVKEYTMMKKLNGNTNVVNCDDVVVTDHDDGIGKTIMIKMELLNALNKAVPTMDPVSLAIKVGRDICKALILCEGKNIIHRDIKPQNIFVSDTGDYKLGDFGVSRTMERTTGGTKIGTPDYMAPEVFRGDPYNHTADIYSLGIVMYWILNNRRTPFLPLPPAVPRLSDKERARELRIGGVGIPEPVNGSIELKRIVLKACAYEPKNRYQSAAEMRAELGTLNTVTVSPAALDEPTILPAPDWGTGRETGDAHPTLPAVNQLAADDDPKTTGLFRAYSRNDAEPAAGSETGDAHPAIPDASQLAADYGNKTTSLFRAYSRNDAEPAAGSETVDAHTTTEPLNGKNLSSKPKTVGYMPENDEEAAEPDERETEISMRTGDEGERRGETGLDNGRDKSRRAISKKKRASDLIKTILIIVMTAGVIYLYGLYPPVQSGILIRAAAIVLCMILALIADNLPLLLFAAVCCAAEGLVVRANAVEQVFPLVTAVIFCLDIICTVVFDRLRSFKAFVSILAVTVVSFGLWNSVRVDQYGYLKELNFHKAADTSLEEQSAHDATGTLSQAEGSFRLAAISSLSGDWAKWFGIPMMQGIELAVEEINALEGYEFFELLEWDDAYDPEIAAAAFDDAADWGANIIVGPFGGYTITQAMAGKLYEFPNIFMICPGAVWSDTLGSWPYLFSMAVGDCWEGSIAGAILNTNLNTNENYAVIYDPDDELSLRNALSFEETAAGNGNYVSLLGYSSTTADFTDQLSYIAACDCDAVFLSWTDPYTTALILAQAERFGLLSDTTWIAASFAQDLLEIEGFDPKLAEGLVIVNHPWECECTGEGFVENYECKYGAYPEYYAALGYDAVYAVHAAIQILGIDASAIAVEEIPELLREGFLNMTFYGCYGGPITWQEDGTAWTTAGTVVIDHGEYRALYQ